MNILRIILTIKFALIWLFLKYCPQFLIPDRDEDNLRQIYVGERNQTRRGKWVLYFYKYNPQLVDKFFAPHKVYYVTTFGTYYYNAGYLVRIHNIGAGPAMIKIYCNTLDFDLFE